METVGDIGTRSSAGCQALAFGGPVSIRIQQPCARCFCLIHFCRHTVSKGANNKWVPVIQMLRAWTLKLPLKKDMSCHFGATRAIFSGSSEGPGMVDALKLAQANQPDTKGTWELVCNQPDTKQTNQTNQTPRGLGNLFATNQTPSKPTKPTRHQGNLGTCLQPTRHQANQPNQPDTKGTWELVCNLFPCTRAIRRCPCFRVWLGLRGFRSICCPKDPQP